jgi:hypothetical protein
MAAWCEAHSNELNAMCEQNVTAGCTVGFVVVVVVVFLNNFLYIL